MNTDKFACTTVLQIRRSNGDNSEIISCISLLGHVAQLVGHLTDKSEVLGSISGLATYLRFSFR